MRLFPTKRQRQTKRRAGVKPSAWRCPSQDLFSHGRLSGRSSPNTGREYLFHRPCPLRRPRHIGGVSPLRPTLTRLASNEPSGSFLKEAITLAPALSSDFSAGT